MSAGIKAATALTTTPTATSAEEQNTIVVTAAATLNNVASSETNTPSSLENTEFLDSNSFRFITSTDTQQREQFQQRRHLQTQNAQTTIAASSASSLAPCVEKSDNVPLLEAGAVSHPHDNHHEDDYHTGSVELRDTLSSNNVGGTQQISSGVDTLNSQEQLSPGLSLLQAAAASSPPPQSYRHSRAYRHFKNPPQPHMCIRTTTETGEELFINVLSWTRIVIPQEPSDPIPLYGGMRVSCL